MPRVHLTSDAEESRLEICFHLVQESRSQAVADRFLESIDEKCRLLATQPRMGRSRPDLAAGVRSFPSGDYMIFYRPIDDGIEVLLVVHGARDIPAIFRERFPWPPSAGQ